MVRVVRVAEGAPYTAMGGEIHRLVHPTTTGSRNLQLSHVRQGPGEAIRRHRHAAEEAYYVVGGTGILHMEGHPPVPLEPGVAVYVPGGVFHHQVNTGDGPLDLITAMSPPLGPDSVEWAPEAREVPSP